MMEESVSTFETHLTAVMDSLIRASVCEITKLFQETVNDYLVELSLSKRENEALKLRLRLTENKLRTERKYGLGWAVQRRNAGLAAEVDGAGSRQKRKVEMSRECGRTRVDSMFLSFHIGTNVDLNVLRVESGFFFVETHLFCWKPSGISC